MFQKNVSASNLLVWIFTFVKYTITVFQLMIKDSGQKRLDRMNQAIEDSEQNVKQVINTVNENYRKFLSANVTHHLHLRDMADQEGDLAGVMHHQVMAEIYQSMLERMYGYSGSPLQ
jgi:hypothetical protein